jgi:hypothetical protein
VKAISIKQPWAGLIASGQKTLELRKWRVAPQKLLVCAAKRPALDYNGTELGVTICTIDVVELVRFETWMASQACIPEGLALDWAGCWAWVLRNPQPVKQVPVVGKLGLFTPH